MWRTWQEACQRTKASLVFFFSCPTKKEFLTQAGRVLNTHPSGLATRQAVRNLVVLRSLSWTLKRKTRQNSPGKYGETAQVKQLVWLFGVIKTHRNMTWQKEWAVDGSSQLVLTGAMVKTWVNCSYWGWSIRIWILYPAEGFLLWDGWPRPIAMFWPRHICLCPFRVRNWHENLISLRTHLHLSVGWVSGRACTRRRESLLCIRWRILIATAFVASSMFCMVYDESPGSFKGWDEVCERVSLNILNLEEHI